MLTLHTLKLFRLNTSLPFLLLAFPLLSPISPAVLRHPRSEAAASDVEWNVLVGEGCGELLLIEVSEALQALVPNAIGGFLATGWKCVHGDDGVILMGVLGRGQGDTVV